MLSYWERRRAREAFQMYQSVEKSALDLSVIYNEASQEISLEARRLFRRFKIKNKLTEREAQRLLQVVADPERMDQIITMLRQNPKNAELAKELSSQQYAYQINRLNQIQRNVDTVTASIITASTPAFRKTLESVAMDMYYRSIFSMQQQANAGFFFNPMTADRVNEILERKWSGESYSKRLWDNTDELATSVKRELVKGMLTGKSPFKMSQAINDRFRAGSHASRRLMRTEANYVANQVTLDSYREAGVTEYIYVAVLDLRTSMICRSLDKKRFLVKNAKVGENYPPMHPWCRSTTIAWMPDYLLRQMKQSAIDPATGERILVAGDMTYEQWYNKYVTKKPDAEGIKGALVSSGVPTKVAKDVEGYLNKLPDDEREAWRRAFKNTNYVYDVEGNNPSRYSASDNMVHLRSDADANTIAHETAHAIDKGSVKVTVNRGTDEEIFTDEASYALSLLHSHLEAGEQVASFFDYETVGSQNGNIIFNTAKNRSKYRKWLLDDMLMKHDAMSVAFASDIIEGVTGDVLGEAKLAMAGHGALYWTKPLSGFRAPACDIEAWADYSALRFTRSGIIKDLEKVCPDKMSVLRELYDEAFRGIRL